MTQQTSPEPLLKRARQYTKAIVAAIPAIIATLSLVASVANGRTPTYDEIFPAVGLILSALAVYQFPNAKPPPARMPPLPDFGKVDLTD